MSDQETGLSTEQKIQFLADKIMSVMVDTAAADGAESGMDRVKRYARRMKMVSNAFDILKPVIDALNEEYDDIRKGLLPDQMQEEDIKTITIDGVGRVQLAGDVYASIPAEQQEAAFTWLRENGYGDLIRETVFSATLKAWAKEGLEQERKMPEDIFKVTPYTRASIVKVNGSKKKK